MKRLGGTDATKIDVFLFIAKDFTKKVCCKFTGLDVYKWTSLQVYKFTSKQVACETYNSFTRSLVNSFTFSKKHLLLVYYFSIFTAEDY